MSLVLEVALLIFAAWLVATAAAFLVVRWLFVHTEQERKDMLDRMMEMIGTIHTYQVQAHTPPVAPDTGRGHWNEEQEDLLANKELTAEQLAVALAEAEFMNTEIELDR